MNSRMVRSSSTTRMLRGLPACSSRTGIGSKRVAALIVTPNNLVTPGLRCRSTFGECRRRRRLHWLQQIVEDRLPTGLDIGHGGHPGNDRILPWLGSDVGFREPYSSSVIVLAGSALERTRGNALECPLDDAVP